LRYLCTCKICFDRAASVSISALSNIKNNKSNLDSNEFGRSTLSDMLFLLLYRPYNGFAAAKTAARAFNVVVIPI
jgi:hypothetical protein